MRKNWMELKKGDQSTHRLASLIFPFTSVFGWYSIFDHSYLVLLPADYSFAHVWVKLFEDPKVALCTLTHFDTVRLFEEWWSCR